MTPIVPPSCWAVGSKPDTERPFLDVVRANCSEVGSRLDEVLARHPAACLATD